ncbi:site-specific DNA-methyltransferase [Fusobacterium nucleatum]|uniref:site-specific DNA-methyltransferase n=1 Tax=Fusobacterium nucleatum TaxID=851 RepID=UPI0025F2C771|nr:site-specific DNA-methyltransferase [uncultured Fusobacterium sp.]
MEKLGMKTKDISKEKFEILKELFPNAVTETTSENKMGGGAKNRVFRTINLDVIRQEINENVIEGKEERYEFTWPEKRKAIVEANIPINKTLRPIREDSQNFDTTENLYIEGDNLEVLKLLRETYLGKIKMIYIDPPYNTGNDFIYNDDFTENEEEYKEKSGNYDEDGNRLFENTKSNGRFHTDWLNMMYPRLKLARDLLTDDGVIFISIDDNEQANLKKVCDEIFGNSNVKGVFTWRKTHTQTNIGDFARVKEYILCYSKNIKKIFFNKIPLTNLSEYRYIDDKGNKFRRINLIDNTRGRYEYSITNFDGKNISGKWMKPKEEIEEMIKNKEVYWAGQTPYGKNYLSKMLEKGQIANDFLGIDYGTNQRSTMKLDKLMEGRIFDFSKPIELLKHFLILGSHPNSIILDFFSGSATTAHAVMQLNAEDGGNRKYIMVQLPDPDEIDKKSDAYKEGYKNICEIGKERIRRASKKIKEENPNSNFDDGFRVLRVDSSNMKDVYYRPEEFTQENLKMFESNIKEDRTGEDLLFQVMLDLGIELSSKIEEKYIQDNKIYDVGENFLLACFDENITEEVVTEIAKLKPIFAIFKEGNKLTDNILINFEEIFKTYSPDTKRRVL